MSATREQSFMKALFHGVIAEELIYPFPSLTLDESDAVALLVSEIRGLSGKVIDAARIDREATIPPDVRAELAKRGLYGLTVPKAHGGLGLSCTAAARLLDELGATEGSVAVSVASHNCMGAWAIQAFGTDEQKRRLLPEVASGRRIASFALTERNAGSDGSAIEASASVAKDGAGYVLDGEKIWITNGVYSDLFVVFARTSQERGHPRITAFIVEAGPGVVVTPASPLVGVRGIGAGTLTLDQARVPFRNVLGEVGHGYPLGLRVLNWGRLGIAATAVGGCKRLLRDATSRASGRRAFRQPIGEFGQTKDKIARMACETWALESIVLLTTGLMDARVEDVILESAIAKIVASETYVRHASAAMRIGAGAAFEQGHPFERALRDAHAHLVLAGTNEILLAFIALAGMQSPSAKLAEMGQAMRDPIKGLGMLTDFAVRRARSTFGRERMGNAHPAVRSESVLFEDGVAGLARETERVLRKHGTAISTRQFVQRRIAEVAIDLYTLAAVISRATRAADTRGEDASRREVDLTLGVGRLVAPKLRDRLTEMERETDELLKGIAQRTYEDGGYPLDVPR